MLQVITLISVAPFVAVDQIIKLLVLEHLEPIGSLPLIDGIVQLNYAENTGAAFGSFSAHTDLLSVFTFVVIVAGLLYLFIKKRNLDVEYVCIALIIAGGLGNLIDRVYRGFVVDYIEVLFVDFYIFNFADCLITVAAFILIFYQLYLIYTECKQKKNTGEADD